MIPASAVATEAARRLWTNAAAAAKTTSDVAAAAERVLTELRTGLVRWIGSEGYHGLLERAFEQTRPTHPWLMSLRCEDGRLEGITAGAQQYEVIDVANGMLALTAALVHVLGPIAGEEMAVRLVDQAWAVSRPATQSADAAMSTETMKGTRDG